MGQQVVAQMLLVKGFSSEEDKKEQHNSNPSTSTSSGLCFFNNVFSWLWAYGGYLQVAILTLFAHFRRCNCRKNCFFGKKVLKAKNPEKSENKFFYFFEFPPIVGLCTFCKKSNCFNLIYTIFTAINFTHPRRGNKSCAKLKHVATRGWQSGKTELKCPSLESRLPKLPSQACWTHRLKMLSKIRVAFQHHETTGIWLKLTWAESNGRNGASLNEFITFSIVL